MMLWSLSHRQYTRHAALFLFTYAFLLRLPSEALPVVCGRASGNNGQATLYKGDNTLVLTLAKRKNKPSGSRLVRGCWCSESRVRAPLLRQFVLPRLHLHDSWQVTCPVHILTPLIFQCDSGERLFRGITAAGALEALRAMLTGIGVCELEKYRTHDLRRGHALDLQLSGEKYARCLLRIARGCSGVC